MILEPAWKLLSIHLSIYTQAVCYERSIEEETKEIDTFEDDEPGIKTMTMQLIDLITTLITNPAIHTLIKLGLNPFASTICEYLILPKADLDQYLYNPLYFIEKSNIIMDDGIIEPLANIRISCTQILESLIETFGSVAIEVIQNIILDSLAFTKDKKVVPIFTTSEDGYTPDDKQDVWKKYELGHYLVIVLSEDLLGAVGKNEKIVNGDKKNAAVWKIKRDPKKYSNTLH